MQMLLVVGRCRILAPALQRRETIVRIQSGLGAARSAAGRMVEQYSGGNDGGVLPHCGGRERPSPADQDLAKTQCVWSVRRSLSSSNGNKRVPLLEIRAVSELCHMTPETRVKLGDLRGHSDAHRCCGKCLMGTALVGSDVRQHARPESISKRAP